MRFAAEIISELDQLAFNFVKALNAQHREGVDIDGAQGMDMFGSAGFEVIKGRTNTGVYSVETSVTDINLAQAEDISFIFQRAKCLDRERRQIKSSLQVAEILFRCRVCKSKSSVAQTTMMTLPSVRPPIMPKI